MKHWLTILALVFSLGINASSLDLTGVWTSGKVELTFNKDTLFIDEVGVEGDVYTFRLDSIGDLILATDALGEITPIKVVDLTKDEMDITYLDSEDRVVYCFKRKK